MVFGAKPKDTIGLGNSRKGKLVKFQIGGSRWVGGVVCSSNPEPPEKGSDVELKCEDVLAGNNKIS
jgi:hypothetical protein